MECRQVKSRLMGLLDGDLHAAERDRMQRHLEGCSACSEELEALRGFDALCQEHLPAPRATYTTADLLRRMHDVASLDPVCATLPSLTAPRNASRLATAALLLALSGNVGQSVGGYRAAATTQQQAIQTRVAKLEAEMLEAGLITDVEARMASKEEQA